MTPDLKLLVLDLDGTTLDARGELNEVDVRAARRLQQAGVQVTIATGRLWTGTSWVADALGVEGSVAVMNGAELVDARSGRTTSGAYLDAPSRAHARRVLAEHGLSAFLYRSRTIHHAHADAHHARYLRTWSTDLSAHEQIFDVPHWDEEDVLAVCAVGEHDAVHAAERSLHPHLPDDHGTVAFDTWFGDRFLQVVHRAYTKGTALKQLAQDRGLRPEQVVAVGDWVNDLPMLRVAGRSFVTGHAIDEVKAAAHEVLDASRDGGAVAEVAAKVWGIR